MPNIDSVIRKLRRRPSQADYHDVERLLLHYGWFLRSEEGSHCTFKKEGERALITVPKVSGKYVKGPYVDRILNILGITGD